MTDKFRIATTSLAGCFGCHMSILDIDERLMELVEVVEFDRSPFTDIKSVTPCDIGLIEGGVANTENVRVLQQFRQHSKVLVALGACAVNGGILAMRNQCELADCLQEAYVDAEGTYNPGIPDDPEIPMMLNKVAPVHEVVEVDYFLPGCPPSAEVIWNFLNAIIEGKPVQLTSEQIRYD